MNILEFHIEDDVYKSLKTSPSDFGKLTFK